MEIHVYTDCIKLVQEFVKSQNYSFQSFSNVWHEMQFQHIWTAQTSHIEIIETTAAALHAAKRLACGKRFNGDKVEMNDDELTCPFRIGGIFLMYALYFKQPTKQFVKIEITLEGWQDLNNFINTLSNTQQQTELLYVIDELTNASGFSYTAHDYHLGLEGLIIYDKPPGKLCGTKKKTPDNERSTFPQLCKIEQEQMPAIQLLEQRYNDMKATLATANGANDKSLTTTNTIFSDLQETMKNVSKLLGSNNNMRSDNRKRNAKKTVELDRTEGNASRDDEKVPRRMSANTIFNTKLPASVCHDLEMSDDE